MWPLWVVPAVAAAAMEQQRGKGGPAGTGDVDHAVAEVLLSPALTCHPFDAFRVLAFRMLLAASSPLFSCSSCGFDCVQEGVSKCDALASVVAAGHAFERFTRRGGSVEEEDERSRRREIFLLSEERRRRS